LLEKIGLQGYTIKSGPYKDMGSPLKKLTPESKQVFQEVVDNIHMQFVRAVAAGRKMDLQQVERLADGRIYSGEQAKAVGLVDRLGNLEDAVQIAAERAGIQGEPRIVTSRPGMKVWWKRLFLEKASQLAGELFFSLL
jgi:protease-4